MSGVTSTTTSVSLQPWDVPRILHNLDILYNHIDRDCVAVDIDGNLQIDKRRPFSRTVGGGELDSSKSRICEVCIRTLRETLNAIENGKIDGHKIIQQTSLPIGLSIETSNGTWITQGELGYNVDCMSYFQTWTALMIGQPPIPDSELTKEQLVGRKIRVLTQMLIYGKATYEADKPPGSHFHDTSDSE